jgi:hypothetical protein
MKKVRVMLAAIAICATVGGLFAFKAKSTYGVTVYTSTTNSGCTIENRNTTTTTDNTGSGLFYVATSENGSCPDQFYLKPQE